jgi:sterol desaturase/sphingolipid hydroxylase (fatty acid hydroxylase superfamily)
MMNESAVRIGVFFTMLVVMAVWEAIAPRRRLVASKPARWISNIALLAINSLIVRLGFAAGLAGIALEAQRREWGLLNVVELPGWLEVALAVILLDLAIYLQHVLFHAVPLLWRLHLVHHADPDFDVTTGVRFHTLEIIVSLGIKVATIVLIGASPLAVVIFEAVLNATSMFSHSNVKMPFAIDQGLRWIVVTPDMHRVHHSMIPSETNSNFGFNVPWWDYVFRTYKAQPALGHEQMRIGLPQIPPERAVWLPWIIGLPFLRRVGAQSIDGRSK